MLRSHFGASHQTVEILPRSIMVIIANIVEQRLSDRRKLLAKREARIVAISELGFCGFGGLLVLGDLERACTIPLANETPADLATGSPCGAYN